MNFNSSNGAIKRAEIFSPTIVLEDFNSSNGAIKRTKRALFGGISQAISIPVMVRLKVFLEADYYVAENHFNSSNGAIKRSLPCITTLNCKYFNSSNGAI